MDKANFGCMGRWGAARHQDIDVIIFFFLIVLGHFLLSS
jgi:hypothetical protein